MDELDRILGRNEDLRPSAGLTDAVMEAVRDEAATPAPLAFPWMRLVAGLAACLVLFVIGIALGRGAAGPSVEFLAWTGPDWEQLAADPRIRNLGVAAGMLVLTWISSRFVVRLTGYGN